MERRAIHAAVTATAVAALVMVLGAGCSNIKYSEDFDRQVPVPSTGTWAWMPLTEAQQRSLAQISPFLQRRIERAVEQQLGARGFVLLSDGPSEYRVSAYPVLPARSSRAVAVARPPVRVSVGVGFGYARPYGYRRPYPYRYGGWGFGPTINYWNPYVWWGWGQPYFGYWQPAVVGSGERGPGALVIDVYDTSRGEIVWQGVADGALLDMPSGDELDEYIDNVVQRTLRGFPPEPAD
ncbi:MAG: DUF4136 domain-containing protein [Gemmatimonadota bacterium]